MLLWMKGKGEGRRVVRTGGGEAGMGNESLT